MTLQTIKERLSQKPFRAFALETVGGTWLDVSRESDCVIFERNGLVRIVIFATNGEMNILEPDQVASVAVK
jgi:hypothetical protein